MAVASGLHANGQETGDTAQAVARLGAALELPVFLILRWGEVILQTDMPDGRAQLRVCAATPSALGMNRVSGIMRCVDAVCAGRMPVAEAEMAVAESTLASPATLPLFFVASAAGASALALIFGALHLQAVALVALSAASGAVLRRLLLAGGAGLVLQAFTAALVAGAIGALAVRWNVSSTLRLVAVCPCMILVPGPHILNGALDILALRIPLGASRLSFAVLMLLAICGGLLLGLALGGTTLPVSELGREVPLWVDALAAGVAAASYGIFFSMPPRILVWPVLAGMAAHGLRWWAMSALGIGPAFGAGLALPPGGCCHGSSRQAATPAFCGRGVCVCRVADARYLYLSDGQRPRSIAAVTLGSTGSGRQCFIRRNRGPPDRRHHDAGVSTAEGPLRSATRPWWRFSEPLRPLTSRRLISGLYGW